MPDQDDSVERHAGTDLALALLTMDVGLNDALERSESESVDALLDQDDAILAELIEASDEAKLSAVMTLQLVARSLIGSLASATSRSEEEIVQRTVEEFRRLLSDPPS
jgi:hypothetical protein